MASIPLSARACCGNCTGSSPSPSHRVSSLLTHYTCLCVCASACARFRTQPCFTNPVRSPVPAPGQFGVKLIYCLRSCVVFLASHKSVHDAVTLTALNPCVGNLLGCAVTCHCRCLLFYVCSHNLAPPPWLSVVIRLAPPQNMFPTKAALFVHSDAPSMLPLFVF